MSKRKLTLGERTENYYSRTGMPVGHSSIAKEYLKGLLEAIGEIYYVSFYGDHIPEESTVQLARYATKAAKESSDHLRFLGEELQLRGKKFDFFDFINVSLKEKSESGIFLQTLKEAKEKFTDNFSYGVVDQGNGVVIVNWVKGRPICELLGGYGLEMIPNFEEVIVTVLWSFVMSSAY